MMNSPFDSKRRTRRLTGAMLALGSRHRTLVVRGDRWPWRSLASLAVAASVLSGCGGGGTSFSVAVEGSTQTNAGGLEGGNIVLKSLADQSTQAISSLAGSYVIAFPGSAGGQPNVVVDRHPLNQLCLAQGSGTEAVLRLMCAPTPLNDTGLTRCRSASTCSSEDAGSGRDAFAQNLSKAARLAVPAGFDYTRICNNGEDEGSPGCLIASDATPGVASGEWGCTRDNVTGLVWRATDYGSRATFLVARQQAPALQTQVWCGRTGWQLPSVHQLQSVLNSGGIERGKYRVAASISFLPAFDFNARNRAESLAIGGSPDAQDGWEAPVRSGFWTASESFSDANLAWVVLLEGAGRVRLQPVDEPQLRMVPVSSDDWPRRFADPYHRLDRWQFDAKAGTLLDRRSGLMWMVCSAGRTYDAQALRCDGAGAFSFDQALAQPDGVNQGGPAVNRGYSDWRLPNRIELASLIDYRQQGPAVSSDNELTAALRADLGTNPGSYWSSSWVPGALGGDAFVVNFTTGEVGLTPSLDLALRVRLVRHAR